MSAAPAPWQGPAPYLAEQPCIGDATLAAFAIADALDTTRPGLLRGAVWPRLDGTSAITRLSACADRIRERAEEGAIRDADQPDLDAALAAIQHAVGRLEGLL